MDSGKEYALADSRWGVADPIIVSVEIVSVLCAGPMYMLLHPQAADQRRLSKTFLDHYSEHWGVARYVLSALTWDLTWPHRLKNFLDKWVMYATEWLIGNENLNRSNPLYLRVYLIVSL